jgi:ankyrin repeat protein
MIFLIFLLQLLLASIVVPYSIFESQEYLDLQVEAGNIDFIREILSSENTTASWGNAAIILAARYRQVHILDMLLDDSRFDPAYQESLALRAAVANGQVSAVQSLLRDGRSDPGAWHSEALVAAAGNGYLDILNLLLDDDRVDILDRGTDAISAASANGHFLIVRRLLEDDRLNQSIDFHVAIREACINGLLDIANLLLNYPFNVLLYGEVCLELAVQYGHLQLVDRLLQDDVPASGESLIVAIDSGHFDIAQILIESGNFVEANEPFVAFSEARADRRYSFMRFLLNQPGFDLGVIAQDLLISAIECAHSDIVKVLLDDPDLDISFNNNLALMTAYVNNEQEIANLIIDDERISGTDIVQDGLETLVVNYLMQPGLPTRDINLWHLSSHDTNLQRQLLDVILKQAFYKKIGLVPKNVSIKNIGLPINLINSAAIERYVMHQILHLNNFVTHLKFMPGTLEFRRAKKRFKHNLKQLPKVV